MPNQIDPRLAQAQQAWASFYQNQRGRQRPMQPVSPPPSKPAPAATDTPVRSAPLPVAPGYRQPFNLGPRRQAYGAPPPANHMPGQGARMANPNSRQQLPMPNPIARPTGQSSIPRADNPQRASLDRAYGSMLPANRPSNNASAPGGMTNQNQFSLPTYMRRG